MNKGLTWLMTEGLDAIRTYALLAPLTLIALVGDTPVPAALRARPGSCHSSSSSWRKAADAMLGPVSPVRGLRARTFEQRERQFRPPQLHTIEVQVDHRGGEQREHLAEDQAADDRDA